MVRAALPLLVLLSTSFARAQEARNLGFEAEFAGGWLVQADGGGPCLYRTGRSAEEPVEGAACVFIDDRAADAPDVWNYFHQYVDAAPYRGRRVRLRAAVRVEHGDVSELRLYLAAVDERYGRLAYVDTDRRPILSARWAHYDLVLEVPAEAARVDFGLVFKGALAARFDDVTLEVLAGAEDTPFTGAGPVNGDFETNAPGEPPWCWSVPFGLQDVCAVETSAEDPHGGRRCARLETRPGDGGAAVGSLVTSFDATPYRGRVVELRVWIKVLDPGDGPGEARLGFAVDGVNASSEPFMERLQEADWRAEWTEVVRAGAVARDARDIHIGFVTTAPGMVFLDDVSLTVVGDLAPAPPRPLDERGARNLVAFARLLGVVRYFHPSDEAAALDWDAFAARGVERVEAAADPEALARALRELFAPVAPTVRILAGDPAGGPGLHPALRPDPDASSLRVTRWEHAGYGPRSSVLYTSRRRWRLARDGALPEGYRDPADPWIVDLDEGLRALVPLVLWRDRERTFPASEVAVEEPPRYFSGDDRTTRLAAVVLAWNLFQHFYPCFDVVEVDWPAELERALHAAATDADARTFRATLARLVAALQDGHGGVILAGASGFLRLPIDWQWIEGRLVVTTSAHPEVALGTEVLRIDDVPAEERIAEVEARTSAATAGYRRRMALQEMLLGRAGSECTLTLRGADDAPVSVTLTHATWEMGTEARPDPLAELEPGIRYVDVSRVNDADFEAALPDLAAADAVVFDFRGYPGALSPTFLGHLSGETLQSPLWCVPRILQPDRHELEFGESSWAVDPREPALSGGLVFVTDSRAISYAETCLQMIAHHALGPIVGETTAGTNGNVNPVEVPGGYTVVWTGMRTLTQDGAVFHGVGVRPTHPVARTVAGVREGRDELLEAALELARR